MESQFAGFISDSFEFFRELARNNNKPWFDQNRERYERHVTGAFRGLNTPAFAKQVEKIFAELYPLYVFTSVSSPRWKAALRS